MRICSYYLWIHSTSVKDQSKCYDVKILFSAWCTVGTVTSLLVSVDHKGSNCAPCYIITLSVSVSVVDSTIIPQTGDDFKVLYDEQVQEVNATLMGVNPNGYGQVCYDATWALALALNKTMSGKQYPRKSTIRMRMQQGN